MSHFIAIILGVVVAVWVTDSRDEAQRYNAKHRAALSTWDAMWLNLDDL